MTLINVWGDGIYCDLNLIHKLRGINMQSYDLCLSINGHHGLAFVVSVLYSTLISLSYFWNHATEPSHLKRHNDSQLL